MIIKSQALVLYKNKGAVVHEVNGDKYTIATINGDRKSVRFKDIELVHNGPCSSIPPAAALPEDTLLAETAELMGSDHFEFADFTELLFGSYTPANALAAVELLTQDIYFHGSITGGVQTNSAEHIKNVLEKKQQKQSQAAAREALLERIRNGSILPEDLSALREIEHVAYAENSSSKLLHDLNMEALPEKAQNLLIKLGVWNEFDNNPHPRRFGVDMFPEYPDLPAMTPEDRIDLTNLTAYAIDDADSNDPDDAIAYDPQTGLLWVHIADPGAVVKADSELEKFACQQGCTSYLPEKIITMLPENSIDIFGLGLQDKSPALSFGIAIDSQGKAELKKLCLSYVKVLRMNYTEAEQLISDEAFAPLVELIERFRNQRINNQAVMIRLPETKIKVNIPQRKISIVPLPHSPIRELVANAMMAAGSAAADFALRNNIPMPFSVQESPEMSERPETVPGMYALRKSCRVSSLSTLPGKHAGLGLEPYSRVTSPLRRYEDLLAHIQLRKYLAGEPLLTIEELDERIACSEPATVMRSKLERQCREYWTLVYLKNHPGNWQGEAVYVAQADERSVWLLPELAFEFKNRYNAQLPLGESLTAECVASDPVMLSTQFKFIRPNTSPETETVNS